MNSITWGYIENSVNEAFGEFLRDDLERVRVKAGERSISSQFTLSISLCCPEWYVHCGYNLQRSSAKTLDLEENQRNFGPTHAREIVLDIIVHKANTCENLLAIEVKKSTTISAEKRDRHNPREFFSQRGYECAVSPSFLIGGNLTIESVELTPEETIIEQAR